MPIITINAIEGRTIEQKRALIKDITDAVVKDFKTKPEQVHITLIECRKENLGHGGKLLSDC